MSITMSVHLPPLFIYEWYYLRAKLFMGEIIYWRISFGRNFRGRAKISWTKKNLGVGRNYLWAKLSMGEKVLGETSGGGRKRVGPNFRGEKYFGRYCLWAKMSWAKLPGAKKFWAKVSMGEKNWAKLPVRNMIGRKFRGRIYRSP